MRMDALHYALLAVLVLLVFYAASTYGLFKERRELMSVTVSGGQEEPKVNPQGQSSQLCPPGHYGQGCLSNSQTLLSSPS